MPTISRFFGILIQMYLDDHPPPHFHAIYGEFDAQIAIDTLEVLRGHLRRPPALHGPDGPHRPLGGPDGLHRLEAFVTPGNTRSVRLLERHGFVIEGTLKDYGYWKGRFWDQLVFGRIED